MCLTVDRISNGQDLIVTGSKDHYIKVKYLLIYFNSSHQHGMQASAEVTHISISDSQNGNSFISYGL